MPNDLRNCKVCMILPQNCDCLCDTCLRSKVIYTMPDYVYEMSVDTRRMWIYREVNRLKGAYNDTNETED